MGELIHDRGRGPEIIGTRVTIYNLLPHFLDSSATESYICSLYELSPEQVAAARAHVLNNPETVLAEHLKIEARLAVGNPPQVIEKAKQTHAAFVNFKNWLAAQPRGASQEPSAQAAPAGVPTFREWFAEQELRAAKGP